MQGTTPLDAYEDFKRIFERFATAEQVTGAEPLGDDTDEEAEAGADDDKVLPPLPPRSLLCCCLPLLTCSAA